MARFGFVGPTYASQSLNADAQRCINWYPESIESGQGKGATALYPAPGLALFATLVTGTPLGGVRGAIALNGRAFFVAGALFAEVDPSGQLIAAHQGNVVNDGLPVSMAASPQEILMASGGIAYVYDLTSNTLTQVDALNNIPVSGVGFSDGFFLALRSNSQQFFVSAPEKATSWDLSNTAIVSVFPDNVLTMLVDHREIWFWGVTKTVVYYDSGAVFPFDVVPGAYIEQGIAAAASAVRLDNSVFWLGADDRGAGIGWRAQGYSPARISNHAVEAAWAAYPAIADAIGYSYQDQGHSFWVLYFPTANATWVYDVSTQMWHERSFRGAGKATDTAHRSRCHAFAFGKHLVGDWASGNVYQMSIPVAKGSGWSFADDFGNPIRRVRRAPHISTEQEWILHSSMQIDIEAGLGPQPPLLDGSGNPRDPQLMMRWSDDGGKTWSNERIMNCGQAGNFKTRAITRRLGRSRDRIYEVAATDPVPWRIVDAYLKAAPGFEPVERMAKNLGKMA
jgi:hypothetical protein